MYLVSKSTLLLATSGFDLLVLAGPGGSGLPVPRVHLVLHMLNHLVDFLGWLFVHHVLEHPVEPGLLHHQVTR